MGAKMDLKDKEMRSPKGDIGTIIEIKNSSLFIKLPDKVIVQIGLKALKNPAIGRWEAIDSAVQKYLLQLLDDSNKRISLPTIPHHNFWLVFQGKEFYKEIPEGYMYANKYDTAGRPLFFFDNLLHVKDGDLIFNTVNGGILAISIAKGNCFDSNIRNSSIIGRQVNVKSIILNQPIITQNYKEAIIEKCTGLKYQPFDKNGNGRRGYLFELRKPLAHIFLREILTINPSLNTEIENIDEYLK